MLGHPVPLWHVAAFAVSLLTFSVATAPAAAAQSSPSEPKTTPTLSAHSTTLADRVLAAVPDLTQQQKDALRDVLRDTYDVVAEPLEHADRQRHEEDLRRIRAGQPERTAAERKRDRDFDTRAKWQAEKRALDLVDEKVLTPAQRPAWQAYRLYFDTVFPLNRIGVTQAQAERIKAIAPEVVKNVPPAKTTAETHARRLIVLRERAKAVLTEQQRKKLDPLWAEFMVLAPRDRLARFT